MSNIYAIIPRMNWRVWVAISGLSWMGIGGFLLYKGLNFLHAAALQTGTLCERFQHVCGGPSQVATAFIALGLIIGFFKGRFVLSKTAERLCKRIAALPSPIRPSQVYPPQYLILLSTMIALGIALRFVPIDIRGLIDVAIGSALLNGSSVYFRFAKTASTAS
jgi:hypothetical protein